MKMRVTGKNHNYHEVYDGNNNNRLQMGGSQMTTQVSRIGGDTNKVGRDA